MADRPIVHPDIAGWLERITPPSDGVLAEMERYARERRFPIVGPQVGRLLFALARAGGARRVFEMGSGFGYSTVWFARAVGPSGRVYHNDGSPEQTERARAYLERAGLADRVVFRTGDARRALAEADGPFDVIFCDIDKDQYPEVPDLAVPRLRRGGLLLFDNTLWFGRVVDEPAGDAATRGVVEAVRRLYAHPELVTSIVPLRDGVSISVRT